MGASRTPSSRGSLRHTPYRANLASLASSLGRGFSASVGSQVARRLFSPGSSVSTGSSRSNIDFQTSAQRDVFQQYRKKKMPRYKKRRWRRFKKKVEWIMYNDLAPQNFIANGAIKATLSDVPANSTKQQVGEVSLYGRNGTDNNTVSDGNRDLANIQAQYSYSQNKQIVFNNARMDVTILNTGNTQIEVDVYDVVFRKQPNDVNNYSAMQAGATDAGTLGSLTKPNIQDRGTTLFQYPLYIANVGAKVLRKFKLQLGGGQSATFMVKDPKTRKFNFQDADETGFIWQGATRTLVCVAKVMPGNVNTSNNSLSMTIRSTRTYHYVINENNVINTGYMVSSVEPT